MPIKIMVTFDALVASALDQLARDATSLANEAIAQLAQADLPDAERAEAKRDATFWARRLRAANKALFHWQKGVRPERTPSGDYLIPSGSRGGVVHRASKQGGVWMCSCEAGQRGEHHWHEDLLTALDIATDAAAIEPDAVERDVWATRLEVRQADAARSMREMEELFA